MSLQWSTRHDESRSPLHFCRPDFLAHDSTRVLADRYFAAFTMVKDQLEADFPGCQVDALPGTPRCGAFEVTGRNATGSLVVYFSKLEMTKFPPGASIWSS